MPLGPRDELNIAAVSESHFSTTDFLLQLVGCLQNQVKGEKFICMLDCAPTHTSAAFREKVKETYPRCVLCYIEPRKTAYTQPLDLAVMRPWKALIGTSAGRQWAESVLAGADPM
eukprot:4414206-Amphidinium_carterae.1